MNQEERKGRLARRIHFSSGHRYWNPNLSEEKNIEIFGSCYSEHGHGHNYTLEAFFEGPIDGETGMIMNLRDVDDILSEVVAPLDHQHLNNDVEHFKAVIPTTENIAKYCFEEIQSRVSATSIKVFKVRLFEGDDLWSDYTSSSELVD